MVFPTQRQIIFPLQTRRFVKGEFGGAERQATLGMVLEVEAGHFAGQLVHRWDKLRRIAMGEDTSVNIFSSTLQAYVPIECGGQSVEELLACLVRRAPQVVVTS